MCMCVCVCAHVCGVHMCMCVCVYVHCSLCVHGLVHWSSKLHSQNDAYRDTVDEHLGGEINVREHPLPQELDAIAESRGGPHCPAGATVWTGKEEADYEHCNKPPLPTYLHETVTVHSTLIPH